MKPIIGILEDQVKVKLVMIQCIFIKVSDA